MKKKIWLDGKIEFQCECCCLYHGTKMEASLCEVNHDFENEFIRKLRKESLEFTVLPNGDVLVINRTTKYCYRYVAVYDRSGELVDIKL